MKRHSFPAVPVAVPALPYASFWRRVISNTLDSCMTVGMVLAVIYGNAWVWAVVIAVAKITVYRAIRTSWGRMMTNTEVFDLHTGQRTGAKRLMVRSLVHITDAALPIGYLLPFWDARRQTFADKIMNTVVLRVDRMPEANSQLPALRVLREAS